MTDGGRTLLDRILAGFGDKYRRYVLYYLDCEESAKTEQLVRQVAAWDADCDLDDVPDERQERVAVQLHHVHLPMLEDLGLIEYDRRSGAVRFGEPPEQLDEFIDLAKSADSISKNDDQ